MTPPRRPVANPFIIIQGGSEKADPATRRLIRSHVRKNENRGRARTRTGHGLYADAANGRRAPWPTTEGKRGGSSVMEAIKPYAPQIPSRVGGDLSFVGVADEIESSILLNIVKGRFVGVAFAFAWPENENGSGWLVSQLIDTIL